METKDSTPTVVPVRRATTHKASGTALEYEIGREPGTATLHLRIITNDGGGTFSKEWVPVARLRVKLRDLAKKGEPFSPGPAVGTAYTGRSRNNGPFLAYALKAEGLLAVAGEKGNLAVVSGDWDAWETSCLAIPVPEVPPSPASGEASERSAIPTSETPAKGRSAQRSKRGKVADTTIKPADEAT